MRDLHCMEGTCTLDPPTKTLVGEGLALSSNNMGEVIPYSEMKGKTGQKKKRRSTKPLKGGGSKKRAISRKLNVNESRTKKVIKKPRKSNKPKTNLQVLKTILQKIQKTQK